MIRTLGLIPLFVVVVAGCSGKDSASVKGKVTCKDKPVTVGTLAFTTVDGETTVGVDIQSDGSYELKEGMVAGKFRVEYQPPFAEGPDDEGWEQIRELRGHKVPDDFTAEIKSGENAIDIELVPGKTTGG